ncbi:lytic transglycosylase domain-containing protein [Acidithiobacillus caldus]|nr:lytic transglycosylase domain-containing protein [Acidithiobacillus caldus]AUW34011.1 lytic transglycosylase domain-containing protein [Acidithiobacillus caldus]
MIRAQDRDWHRLAGPFSRSVEIASQKTGLSPMLLAAVVYVESRGQAKAVSSAGAIGPMQLMPATALRVLHVNPWQIQQNILGGAEFLQHLLRQFHGNLTLALEAYNAGPTRVSMGEPLPPSAMIYAETVEARLRWAKAGIKALPIQVRATS